LVGSVKVIAAGASAVVIGVIKVVDHRLSIVVAVSAVLKLSSRNEDFVVVRDVASVAAIQQRGSAVDSNKVLECDGSSEYRQRERERGNLGDNQGQENNQPGRGEESGSKAPSKTKTRMTPRRQARVRLNIMGGLFSAA
jgi:hypothetical protein